MNVLIGCEYSGMVASAFAARGHRVVSCDLLPCEPHHLSEDLSLVLSRDLSPGVSPGLSPVLSPGVSLALSSGRSFDLSTGWTHYTGDVFDLLPGNWDLFVAFPPCTYLAKAQAYLLSDPSRLLKHWQAMEFVKNLFNQPIPKIAIENPVGLLNTKWQMPNQITSFNNFGDPYFKEICFWLKGLPTLRPTKVVPATKKVSNHVNSRMSREQRTKIKSRFFPGIARAMADQWG